MTERPTFEFKLMSPLMGGIVPLPEYKSAGAAAMDLAAAIDAPIVLEPAGVQTIGVGFAVYMRDPKWCAVVKSRSGLFRNHHIEAFPGLIDSDYQGEIAVVLSNLGRQPFTINPGDRIAQLKFELVVRPNMLWVDAFSEESVRGTTGWGSSGLR